MSNTHERPEQLPDYQNPPLNEVVLGVQFTPPRGYQQIYAGDVWKLFRSEYPVVQEQPPLPPNFEIFGLPHTIGMASPLNFVTGALHDRFWFLAPKGEELIQFQQDRMLHNWRKIAGVENDYPRFESMIKLFRNELHQLQDYFAGLAEQKLAINQCEISYINHIEVDDLQPTKISNWLNFINFPINDPEDFVANFRETIKDENGNPLGRIIYDMCLGISHMGKRAIVLTLTFRGGPISPDIDSALKFIEKGRELIVCRFTEITTPEAHEIWRRQK